MALVDIRQRTGYLFLTLIVGHVILISTQVTTKRGVPLLASGPGTTLAMTQTGQERIRVASKSDAPTERVVAALAPGYWIRGTESRPALP